MIKDYYEEITSLSLKTCTRDDYGTKARVREHNRAMSKIQKLTQKMHEEKCYDAIPRLLSHEDDRVRLSAVTICMQAGIYQPEIKAVLKDIEAHSLDPTFSFSAQMLLKQL